MKDKSQLYEECKRRYKIKELTSRKAAELCQISQATFLQWIKQDENYNPDEIVKVTRLCALRAERGISAYDLADLSGVSKASIYNCENQKSKIGRSSTIKICRALGVDDMLDLNELVEIPNHILHGAKRKFV